MRQNDAVAIASNAATTITMRRSNRATRIECHRRQQRHRQRGGEAEPVVEGDFEQRKEAENRIDGRCFPTGEECDHP